MMPVDTWKSWSRSGMQSHADLWLIAARTQTQLSECHGQAVQSLIRNWPHLASGSRGSCPGWLPASSSAT